MPGVSAVLNGEDVSALARPLRALSNYETYMATDLPPLAVGKVRYVGEAVAVVVAQNRYLAEDAAELVRVEYEPLDAVVDAERALEPDSPRVFDEQPGNCFVVREIDAGDVDAAFREADVIVRETFRTQRQAGIPLETRGCIAEYDPARQELTFRSSNQVPHILRSSLAECLSMPEHRIRVIAPDVGGGFGIKGNVYPEEIVVAALAIQLQRPVGWVEDRREHFYASAHARDHVHHVEVAARKDGAILGLRATAIVDSGAYSVYPFTCTIEPRQVTTSLTGLYKIQNYSARAFAVATNKAPAGPYRGVARPSVYFTLERAVDEIARQLNLDPADVRLRNYVQPDEFPYTSAGGLVFDSGSYVESLRRLLEMLDYEQLRGEQRRLWEHGRYLGIGLCCFNEQTGVGAGAGSRRGSHVNMGYEPVTVRFDPSGRVTVYAATFSHGQGHETTLAQLAADELGVPLSDIAVVQGDTTSVPYGFGTFASRSAVLAGGATIKAATTVRDKVCRIAAHWLEASPQDLELEGGRVRVRGASERSVTIREVARAAYLESHRLPADEEPGLEATERYTGPPGTGTYSNAAHAAVVEVDTETGVISLLRYLAVEDCGKVINPLIVEGQVVGGVAQGIGGAMYEHLVYDEQGQLLTTAFLDYLVPTANEIPTIELDHLETPSPFTIGGIKGMGESGTVGPGAAIANAVTDALAPFGVRVTSLPLDPQRVWALIRTSSLAGGASIQAGR